MSAVRHFTLGEIGPVRMCKRIMKGETSTDDEIPFFKIGTFGGEADVFISRERYEEYKSKYPYPKRGDVLISAAGTIGRLVVFDGSESYFQDCNIVWVENDETKMTNECLYYALQLARWKPSQGSTILRLYNDDIRAVDFFAPEYLPDQKQVAAFLSAIDRKIALNRKRIATLEAMAKEIYDYWFVQFDFPDAHGRPYKSSGGAMVYNPDLKREIPKGWEVRPLADAVKELNSGEWGSDACGESSSVQVHCLRGADMEDQSHLPVRYISKIKTDKLLRVGDIVIEMSGGSPTQATGRSCYVSQGLLDAYNGMLTCTNFCNSLKLKESDETSYFYFVWRMFYRAGLMFNFEGKTSGLKNLQIDSLLTTKWVFPPKELVTKFNKLFLSSTAQTDNCKKEISRLSDLRDFLLPVLMDGQVRVMV